MGNQCYGRFECPPPVQEAPKQQPMCGVIQETWGKPVTISVDGQTEDMHKRMVKESYHFDQDNYDKALAEAAKRKLPVVAVIGSWEHNNAKQASQGLSLARQMGARDAVYIFIDPAKCPPGSDLQKDTAKYLEGGHNNAKVLVFSVKPDAQTGKPVRDTEVFDSLGLDPSRIDSLKSGLNHAQAQADRYGTGSFKFSGDLPAEPKPEPKPESKAVEVAPPPQPVPAKTLEAAPKPREVTPVPGATTGDGNPPEGAPKVQAKADAPAPAQPTAKEKELQAALDQAQAELKKLQEKAAKDNPTGANPNDKDKRRQEDLITFAEGAGSALFARWLFNKLRGGGASGETPKPGEGPKPGDGPKSPEGLVDPEVDRAAKKALALPENANQADIERAAKERLGITANTTESEMQQKIREKLIEQARDAYKLPNASVEDVRQAVLADNGAKLKLALGLPLDATPADILAKVVADAKPTPELPPAPKVLPAGPNGEQKMLPEPKPNGEQKMLPEPKPNGEQKMLPAPKGANPGEAIPLPEGTAPKPVPAPELPIPAPKPVPAPELPAPAPEASGRIGPPPSSDAPLTGAPEPIKLENGVLTVANPENPDLALDTKAQIKDIFDQGYANRKAEIEKRISSKDPEVRKKAEAELAVLESQKTLFNSTSAEGAKFRQTLREAVVKQMQTEIRRAGGKVTKGASAAVGVALIFNFVMDQFDESGNKK